MSYLIDDSSFETWMLSSNRSSQSYRTIKDTQNSVRFTEINSSSNSKKFTLFSNKKTIFSSQENFMHKFGIFSLVVLKTIGQFKKYQFQGVILQRDQKFTIKFKQKRIYFGKQLMKQRKQSRVKVLVNFSNGQIRLSWPEIFSNDKQSLFNSNFGQKRLFNTVFLEIMSFFQNEFIPTCKQIIFSQRFFTGLSNQKFQQFSVNRSRTAYENIEKLERYLYLSTSVDTFQRDKQTYKKLQDKQAKQKQSIIKIQKGIDFSFCNIGAQIQLYNDNSLNKIRKKLCQLGVLEHQEQKTLEEYIWHESSRNTNQNQCQYIYNCIGILKVQNRKRFLSSGGTCNIYMTKMIFQFVYSDDSRFWIEQNKKSVHNALEKNFVVKQAKVGFEEKLRHQNMILRQMKGGYSIYLSKYYRIQNIEKDATRLKTQDLIIMDFLRGQTLDRFCHIHRQNLSFWTKIFLIKNIVNGLRFISSYKIVHMDLKPNNIIVVNDLLTKIIDFSESYHIQICRQTYAPGLSLPYSAPQIILLEKLQPDQKCDIFSLGVIMFQILLGGKFMEISKEKLFKIFSQKKFMQRIFMCPELIIDENLCRIINIMMILIIRCLDPRPQYRPTLNWVSIIINQALLYFKGS